ncbi:hypothetical protein SMKC049_04700 [Serratia marcescens]|nr:hypothetical protein SMKC049_04700 [Serratia marcescens]
MLMNFDTLVAMRNPPLIDDSLLQEMYAINQLRWRIYLIVSR